jgi:hypothetical protein
LDDKRVVCDKDATTLMAPVAVTLVVLPALRAVTSRL